MQSVQHMETREAHRDGCNEPRVLTVTQDTARTGQRLVESNISYCTT
jgi:hypothetical protein